MGELPALTELSEAERDHAFARLQIVRPFLEAGVPLATLAGGDHPSLRTLRTWVARYRAHGLAGLARQPRADRGMPQRLTPQVQQLIEGLALQRPPPTAAHVHRQVARIAQEHGWPVPSYRTVAARIQTLDATPRRMICDTGMQSPWQEDRERRGACGTSFGHTPQVPAASSSLSASSRMRTPAGRRAASVRQRIVSALGRSSSKR